MKSFSIKHLIFPKRTVAGDLMFWIGLASSLTIILLGTVYYIYITESLYKSLNDRANEITEEITNVLILPLFNIDDETVRHTAEVYLTSGRLTGIRIESNASGILVDNLPDIETIMPRRKRSIVKDGLELGTVEILFDDSDIKDVQRETIWIMLISILAIVSVNTLVIRYIMRFSLIIPLERLNRCIENIARGLYQGSVDPVPQEDLNGIISAANRMSQKVADSTRQLIESESRYRGIFDNAVAGIYQCDLSGRITIANNALARILGYDSPEQLVDAGIKIGDLLCGEQRERQTLLERLLGNERIEKLECRMYRKDKSVIWVSINAATVYDKDGKPFCRNGLIVDISERRQAEEELERHRMHLEDLVKERTRELEERTRELERFNRLFVGRELRIKELKEEIKRLKKKIKS